MLLAVSTRSVPQKSVSDLQLIPGTSPWHQSLEAMIHICLVTKQTSMLAVTVNLHSTQKRFVEKFHKLYRICSDNIAEHKPLYGSTQ